MVDAHTMKFLPHVGPWTQNANITARGDLYATWHLYGFASELAPAQTILGLSATRNQMAINIGRAGVEFWVHLTRRKLAQMTSLPECEGWYARRFDASYRGCMGDDLYVNDLWFTVLLPPPTGLAAGLKGAFASARRLLTTGHLKETNPVPSAAELHLQDFDDLTAKVHGGLAAYGPTRLGLVPTKSGGWNNQIDEAFGIILNNNHNPMPLSRGRCGRNIDPYEVDYGDRDWCVHTGSTTRTYGTIYTWMNYPAMERPIMFDEFLSAPFAFTMTNSGEFLYSSQMLQWLGAHTRRMFSAADASKTQQKELLDEQDDLVSRRAVWVRHHFSLAVFSDKDLRDLDAKAVEAETMLKDAWINPVREDRAIKPARFAQLPGNKRWRTRPQKIPSRCFVDFAAPNNVPKGRLKGRWGPPLLILRTRADTEYPFHFHVQGSAQIPKEDLGSTLVFGPSGSGKTGLIGSLMLTASRQGARVVVGDKDCGLGPMVLAADGSYLVLEDGQDSGIPLLRGLSDSLQDVDHIVRSIKLMIMSDGRGPITSSEEDRLPHLVRRTQSLPAEMREMAAIAVGLGAASETGARARLRKWCWGQELGWVLDGRRDRFDLSRRIVGFDTTSILKNPDACGPLQNEIFYRTGKLIDGKPLVMAVDELWHVEQNAAFSNDNNDKLATIRKLEGVLLLATQNARSVLQSRHAHTYVQQVPTKIFFADADSSHADLVDGLHLTEAEFEAVTSKLAMLKHAFLLKRPSGSVICRYDLSRRPDQIAVISGRKSTYELALALRKEHGEAPHLWVPHYEKLAPLVVDDPQVDIKREKAA